MNLSITDNATTTGAPQAAATTTATPTEAPAPGSEGYEAYMQEQLNQIFAGQNKSEEENTETTTEGDSLILGKFKSQDDLVKAYQEAQAELTRVKQGAAKTEAPKVAPTAATEAAPGDVDTAKYNAEIQTSGALSEASYAELAAKGYSKAMVDSYIEGRQAAGRLAQVETEQAQARDRNEVLASAGGEENYKAMASWASANLSADEIARFDASVADSKNAAMMAVAWLSDRYKAANGSRPTVRITGANTPAVSGAFESQSQIITAMQDKRYATDPAYRADVERRVKASMQM